jgi:hypothetical protein
MGSVDRQNRLIAAEDWTKIYQSFRNADFQSYDFDNLRRTMIAYLRDNYPEDFNDYIESSEYLALIDLIAFLGQNLAFRFDLNARDNFLELAERRESVLRLARLLSYNPKRNIPANGLLKFSALSTTEEIIDSNGRNLSGQTVLWNDPSNANWYEQFIKIINSSMNEIIQFGRPQDKKVIGGVATEQYRVNGLNTEIPVYSFTKNIDGRTMDFDVVSTVFKDSDSIYEEPPLPGNNLAFLYRDDGGGPASSNTGFFLHFRQGTLEEGNFTVDRPTPNEVVDLDSSGINNTDIWLYSTNALGAESTLWTQVESIVGNNIIYNSTQRNSRKLYSVQTRSNDRVRLAFADGVFGDLPQGSFRAYYRISNGLAYKIAPGNIKSVTIDIPYLNRNGKAETLSIVLSLKYTVTNASSQESTASIKQNAPGTYYTQNRMITGEDYNVLPLSVSQEILKVKSVNRLSSGISRYFDLKDVTGKYSSTNLFGTDGIVYKENFTETFNFSFATKSEIESVVVNQIIPVLKKKTVYDFYLDNFSSINLGVPFIAWNRITKATNLSTGFFSNNTTGESRTVGAFTSSNLRYAVNDSLLKFVPPPGFRAFDSKNNFIANTAPVVPGEKSYIWTKVVNITGSGVFGATNTLPNGEGPIKLNEVIPSAAELQNIIPKFVREISDSVRNRIFDLIFAQKEFALRYDAVDTAWKIITESNVDKLSNFSLGKTGDISNQRLDASWLILFETDGETYTVTNRSTRYVFESIKEVRFFFDSGDKIYDTNTGKIVKDKISVLSINPKPLDVYPLNKNYDWEIIDEFLGADGYIDSKKISVTFTDKDEDGVIDDPEIFERIVETSVEPTKKIIFQQRKTGLDGVTDYYYISNDDDLILTYNTQLEIDTSVPGGIADGQLVYSLDDKLVKRFIRTGQPQFQVTNEYRGFFGRGDIKFQYVHSADSSARLDPSATNIMDVYVLTKSYDTEYRRWVKQESLEKPLPPSSDALFINFGTTLQKVKAISDEVIYHPVKYKEVFGPTAPTSLQATFKIVKNNNVSVSDSDIKASVTNAINEFFAIENWEFGDTFFFAELTTYIMNRVAPNISNIVIVPKDPSLSFGSLYEIKSNSDEIFISSATVNDIEIISEITASRIRANGTVTTTLNNNTGIQSSNYGI